MFTYQSVTARPPTPAPSTTTTPTPTPRWRLKTPGLVSFTTEKCQSLGRGEPPYYMVARLAFETAETMKTALTSPEMAAASPTRPNFATGGATLYSAEATVIR